ncbi:MAG: hypothetical protein NTU66_04620 [Elusimicrobia bacterium]|nr:hypothetical protein [Elusimicrobiota bacterium]
MRKNMLQHRVVTACMMISCMAGCSHVQINYGEQEPRKSMVSAYRVTKTTKKAWDNTLYRSFPLYRKVLEADLKKYGVTKTAIGYCIFLVPPAVDLVILPFQALYDAVFTYKRVYTEQAVVSGRLVDEEGNPVPHAKLSVSGSAVTTDEAGNIAATVTYTGPYEPSGQITVKLDETAPDAIAAGYRDGAMIALTLPLQVRFSIQPAQSGSVITRDDSSVKEVKKSVGRDTVTAYWETVVSSGTAISVRRRNFFSQKNKTITAQEYAVVQVRKIQRQLLLLDIFDAENIFSIDPHGTEISFPPAGTRVP